MRLRVPDVRVADVETCDFSLVPRYDTATLLQTVLSGAGERYLTAAVSRKLIQELGVEHRYLTQCPGLAPAPARLSALDLARSAIHRLQTRRRQELEWLDAFIFVSTSNPSPVTSQAALLASEFGFHGSCFDLKAGCSGGVLGLMQAALLIRAGCERVLVVMAENLSQLTPAEDLRMLLTVGDGAAAVLLERHPGPGFLSIIHGSAPEYAGAMAVPAPFPPRDATVRYQFEFRGTSRAAAFIQARWPALYGESLKAAGIGGGELAQCFVHQTHAAQVARFRADHDLPPDRVGYVAGDHGNMGSPTFAVAMASKFCRLQPGDKYLMQAVGGGISWCAIVAEHR
jgi:3-oxoacyl-[acyl-carrier-protein] synthase-3